MTDKQWGPWIEHDGKGCPCVGMWVECVFPSSVRQGRATGGVSWFYDDATDPGMWTIDKRDGCIGLPIIRYRIRKPKGMIILEELLNATRPDSLPAVDGTVGADAQDRDGKRRVVQGG